MDLKIYTDVAINGIALFPVVLGLSQILKEIFKLEGRGALILALVVGFILGFGYMLAVAFPVNYTGWFAAVIYALGLGVTTTGVYKVAGQFTDKIAEILLAWIGKK